MTIAAKRKTVMTKLDRYYLSPPHETKHGEPAWDVALLFPNQGEWTEEEYLGLTNSTNRMAELVDGCLELLPLPDLYHQGIVRFLFRKVDGFATAHDAGEVFFAPSPIRLWKGRLREPDIFFLRKEQIHDRKKPPRQAALAMEVVSEGKKNRERDLKEKRKDYARAKIQEYWIVDPQEKCITVLTLSGKSYKVHGEFKLGERATSKCLPGFGVLVDEVFTAGEGIE